MVESPDIADNNAVTSDRQEASPPPAETHPSPKTNQAKLTPTTNALWSMGIAIVLDVIILIATIIEVKNTDYGAGGVWSVLPLSIIFKCAIPGVFYLFGAIFSNKASLIASNIMLMIISPFVITLIIGLFIG